MNQVTQLPGVRAYVQFEHMKWLLLGSIAGAVLSVVLWALYLQGVQWITLPAGALFALSILLMTWVQLFGIRAAERRAAEELEAGYTTVWQRHPAFDFVDSLDGTVLREEGAGKLRPEEYKRLIRQHRESVRGA